MIVGADGTDDAGILKRSATLYAGYGLKRVYYSAFSPIPDASSKLPMQPPPLLREHRLYQADWLMRFYGFGADEIVLEAGYLDLKIDPKLAWALQHRDAFPLDVNRADRALLLRVPGLGVRSVDSILAARRHHRLRLEDVVRLGASAKSVRPFIVAEGWSPGTSLDSGSLRAKLTPEPQQLSLF
jgi:predicted DNA-binding helix-hairpin-helix protein